MKYSTVFPIIDIQKKYKFEKCHSAAEFLDQVIEIYKNDPELRIQQACLSVFLAFKDHYPSYLKKINLIDLELINKDLKNIDGKVIKLRRMVLSQLSKVI